ncbi:MAG: hypothetical protein J5594_02935 [Elusimicrobiaceae bacterium]|nr:hypothetical protein [Elusimicrobiaceae bacterium]
MENKKICFVCHANICRSFSSECFLKDFLCKAGRNDVEVISRGIYAQSYFEVPGKITSFLASKGITQPLHTATLLSSQDMQNCNLVLTMTEGQKEYILDNYAQFSDKVFTLHEYVYGKEQSIKDPISLTGRNFEKVLEEIYKTVKDLTQKI